MDKNILLVKSKAFAIRIIELYKYLAEEKREYVLSKQILRSGTSIGANIHEAVCSISKKEFIAKRQISLKEATETEYWLELLKETDYISAEQYESINADCVEIIRLLTAALKSAKEGE